MSSTTTRADLAAAAPARPRGLFFQAFAGVLLLTVLVGFSRTFFLRPLFDENPIALTMLLALHGTAVTAWFALFFVQALLVHRNRIATHRRLGAFGALVAALMVPSCLAVVFDIVHSWRAAGIDVEESRQLLSMIVWGNLGAVLAFLVFFVRGVLKRRVADAHKRLMLLASIAIISPAISRIAFMPMFAGTEPVLVTVLGLLVVVGVLVVFDLVSLRKVHRETLWGVPFFLFVHIGGALLMAGTPMDAWLMARIW